MHHLSEYVEIVPCESNDTMKAEYSKTVHTDYLLHSCGSMAKGKAKGGAAGKPEASGYESVRLRDA